MDLDCASEDLPEGVFASFSLWIRVLEFAHPTDVCSFSQVSLRYNALVHIMDYDNESMWRSLLKREYQMTDSAMKRFAKAGISFRSIFIAYCRSRISPVGIIMPRTLPKQVRKSETLQRWANLHGLRPFYVAQLYHTSTHGPKTIVSSYSSDEDSYFGQVLELRRCWNIQVEGGARVWRAGYYRVVWRLKLAVDYEDLGPLQFLSKVVESDAMKHLLPEEEAEKVSRMELTWAEEELVNPFELPGMRTLCSWNPPNPLVMPPPNQQNVVAQADPQLGAIAPAAPQLGGLNAPLMFPRPPGPGQPPIVMAAPFAPVGANLPHDPALPAPLGPVEPNIDQPQTGKWFDLLAGFIHVPHAHDAVCFALTNFTVGYKYGLLIDYVALRPITESEFHRQDQFPLGPTLMDDHQYWDSLCDAVADQA